MLNRNVRQEYISFSIQLNRKHSVRPSHYSPASFFFILSNNRLVWEQDAGTNFWRTEEMCFDSQNRQKIYLSSPKTLHRLLKGNLSPGANWPGHEADPSSPSRPEVKNVLNYTSTPPYAFTWNAQGQLYPYCSRKCVVQ
jgi:hypothetical protein